MLEERYQADAAQDVPASPHRPGDRVRIVRGILEGYDCEILASDPRRRTASVAIDIDDRRAVLEVRFCELAGTGPVE